MSLILPIPFHLSIKERATKASTMSRLDPLKLLTVMSCEPDTPSIKVGFQYGSIFSKFLCEQ